MPARSNPLTEPVFLDVCKNLPERIHGTDLVAKGYQAYKDSYGIKNRNRNGRIFELLILESLRRANIGPVYYQTKFHFVPNVEFDILLYHPKKPVVLSCKTSLRERYKQAVLEGFVLKQVYRNAQVYLLTLDRKEGTGLQRKIAALEVVGIDQCIVIEQDNDEYDQLLSELRNVKFVVAESVEPLAARHFLDIENDA